MYDHQLKTAPKGFSKDHQYIDLLRYKSYVFSTAIEDDILCSPEYIEYTVNAFRQLHQVNAFLNEAIDNFDEKK